MLTLGACAFIGVAIMALAARLRVPAIGFLLIAGAVLGRAGAGLIEPAQLGHGLRIVVASAVAVILFEGGLTLDLKGLRQSPKVIGRLLTLGVLITWFGTTGTLVVLFDLPLGVALLAASLVIVTGPTVVSPLLRRVGVDPKLRDVLYWEAVVVDAVGVLIAALCFEWLLPDEGHSAWSPLLRFGYRVGLGLGIGLGAGALLAFLLRSRVVPDEHSNILVLSGAIATFALCDHLLHESGVLAVIVAGLIVGTAKPRCLRDVKQFELELTELLIGMIFVLLAANLDPIAFLDLGWPLVAAVAVVVVVLRPLAVVLSTWNTDFGWRDKAFLSWIAPRGVVAASMASLFAIEMAEVSPHAQIIETFTFAIIATTVILQGFTAGWVARLLGVAVNRDGVLVVGELALAQPLAESLVDAGVPALALIPEVKGDEALEELRCDELSTVIYGPPLERDALEDPRFNHIGAVIAVSHNPFFNELIAERWTEHVGEDNCYRWNPLGHRFHDQGGEDSGLWSSINPAEVISQLESGRLALGVLESTANLDETVPLVEVHDGRVRIVFDSSERNFKGKLVALHPPHSGLADLINGAVLVSDRDADFRATIGCILERAYRDHPELRNEGLLDSIVKREQSLPTSIGRGIAVPHSYSSKVSKALCYAALVTHGLTTAAPDGLAVKLVFLVLSPENNSTAHLRSLALIAKLSADPFAVQDLSACETSEDLLREIRSRHL